MADVLEENTQVRVLRHVYDKLPVVVGDGLQVVVNDLNDRILNRRALFIHQGTHYNGLLSVCAVDKQAKQSQYYKAYFFQIVVLKTG